MFLRFLSLFECDPQVALVPSFLRQAFPVVSESLRTASTMSHHEQVVVFTGLFQAAPNADALASVLGHEVGHVVANHGGEKLSKVIGRNQWLKWGCSRATIYFRLVSDCC